MPVYNKQIWGVWFSNRPLPSRTREERLPSQKSLENMNRTVRGNQSTDWVGVIWIGRPAY